jgi:hypothetical protein
MTVAKLIEELKRYDPDEDVFIEQESGLALVGGIAREQEVVIYPESD